MRKKILFTYGRARSPHDWGMIGEIAKRLTDDKNNEVYFLDCNGVCKGFCWCSTCARIGYCNKCKKPTKKILKLAGLKEQNILPVKLFKVDSNDKFKTIQDMIDCEYKGMNIGVGPVSIVMTMTRDYNFNVKKWSKYIQKTLTYEKIILENIIKYDKIFEFDEFHCFNGRTTLTYPLVTYAKKNNRHYVTYEVGANLSKIQILHNTVVHDFDSLKECINLSWDNQLSEETKISAAKQWFEDRRKGKFQAQESFTKDQIKNLLPANYDSQKENIVFFNSSIDEVYAFKCWQHPFAKNENEILEKLFEHYKNDTNKHFYLRIHPNLTRAKKYKSTQIKEINLLKRRYKNLTVIEPDDNIDTYALMDVADKVVTTYSTAGFEATYWGKVSIIAGKAPYEDLDCVYKANSFEDLWELIDNKDLKPKKQKNTYKYAYYNQTIGEKYKYFIEDSLNNGTFLGVKLLEKYEKWSSGNVKQ